MVEFGTSEELWYMRRIEEYLVYKYRPHLVDQLKITFGQAKVRRDEVVVQKHHVFKTADDLLKQVESDLTTNVPWKPKKSSHKAIYSRPGIGEGYQKKFTEL